jgi:hypothetical protein
MMMRWMATMLGGVAIAACATASFEGTPIAEWAGAYGNPQPPPPEPPPPSDDGIDRPSFWRGEDSIEIRPIGPTRARIDVMLFYPRGHQCALAGPADLEDGRLVLRQTNEYGRCEVTISREMNRNGHEELVVRSRQEEEGSGACYISCGANARLSGSVAVSTRHALPRTPATEAGLEE